MPLRWDRRITHEKRGIYLVGVWAIAPLGVLTMIVQALNHDHWGWGPALVVISASGYVGVGAFSAYALSVLRRRRRPDRTG